jgi:mannose-6-phosphate isomerase-like protein (cupin superfamily)
MVSNDGHRAVGRDGDDMTLYIAGVNEQGRSYVESRKELEDMRVIRVWEGSLVDLAATIAGMAPGPDIAIEPPLGGVRWVCVQFPSDAEAAAAGYTPMGFHCTRTVDFDYVLAGELNCVLDDETVELNAGDFIVLRMANHRWVNRGKDTVTILCWLHQPAVPAGASH